MAKKISLIIICMVAFQLPTYTKQPHAHDVTSNCLAICIDESEYGNKRLGSITRQTLCSIADASYPFIVSKQVIHNAINLFPQYQADLGKKECSSAELITFITHHFIVKDAQDFYVFIPIALENIPGLRTHEFKTISLHREPPPASPINKLLSLQNIFSKNGAEPTVGWNIYALGHGSKDSVTFGLKDKDFVSLLDFFKKNIRVNVIYLESCFALGKDQKNFESSAYPFTIIAASLGENICSTITKAEKPFPHPCKNNVRSLWDGLSPCTRSDYYEIFKTAGFVRTLDAGSLLQIRPRNSNLFIPLISPKDRALLNISKVIGKTNSKKPLSITPATKLIMVSPEHVQFPIIFQGNFDKEHYPRIVSMLKGQKSHIFEKIEFQNEPDGMEQLYFLSSLFASNITFHSPKRYLVKEVTFSKPFTFERDERYKDITSLKNVVITLGPLKAQHIIAGRSAPELSDIDPVQKELLLDLSSSIMMLYTAIDKNGKKYYLQESGVHFSDNDYENTIVFDWQFKELSQPYPV